MLKIVSSKSSIDTAGKIIHFSFTDYSGIWIAVMLLPFQLMEMSNLLKFP